MFHQTVVQSLVTAPVGLSVRVCVRPHAAVAWWSFRVDILFPVINWLERFDFLLICGMAIALTTAWQKHCCPCSSCNQCGQPVKANSAFHPSAVGIWVPDSAEKAKAGMVHSVSGWTRGVQVKLWDPLRTRARPERLRGVFTTRRHTNPRLPLPLPVNQDACTSEKESLCNVRRYYSPINSFCTMTTSHRNEPSYPDRSPVHTLSCTRSERAIESTTAVGTFQTMG